MLGLRMAGGLNLVYQFRIHAEQIGLPRHLDRSHAGVFIIRDRMFGSFEPERADDPPRYGIVKNLARLNPLWAAVHEWVAIAGDLRHARSVGEAWGRIARPPGWQPDGKGDTAAAIRARWLAGGPA